MNFGKIALIASGVFAVLLLLGGIFSCSSYSSTRNEIITRERALSTQYLSNQNYLSAFISGFYEQVGVQQAAGEQLDTILLDAVKGRYDEGGFQVGSSFFTAVVEAYPEAGVAELMANWGKILDYIQGQREGYRNVQDKLLDMLRAYDTWRESGIWRGVIMNGIILRPPTHRLEARIGDTVLTGEAARQKMLQIVLTSDAKKAYETGEMEPLKVP